MAIFELLKVKVLSNLESNFGRCSAFKKLIFSCLKLSRIKGGINSWASGLSGSD